jgi:membrane associated rhomboid family serine protease
MAFNNSYRPSQSTTPVVLNLIIINAIVFVAQLVFDKTNGQTAWLTNRLALYSIDTGLFEPYQLVTHMFAHAGFFHILFNMYALWLFGAVLERSWGPKKFLIFYIVCGLAAALAQMFFVPQGAAIGASGAVMGLLAAFAYTYPNIEFFILPIPFPIKAKYLAAIYAAIDIFGGFSGAGDNVAHFAHLGGLVMGFILVIIWGKNNKKKWY